VQKGGPRPTTVQVRRIYEAPNDTDGLRVLVDRLWPRGWAKARLGYDLWLRDVAPSPELRDWYHHQTDRFPQFQTRYAAELAANPAFQELADLARTHPAITLLTASRDVEHSQAVVLQQRLTAALAHPAPPKPSNHPAPKTGAH
jgi:uncharacterized protein YeaO (DUF488 family)